MGVQRTITTKIKKRNKKETGNIKKFPKKIVSSKKINEKERAKGQQKEPKGKNSDRKEPHKDTSCS